MYRGNYTARGVTIWDSDIHDCIVIVVVVTMMSIDTQSAPFQEEAASAIGLEDFKLMILLVESFSIQYKTNYNMAIFSTYLKRLLPLLRLLPSFLPSFLPVSPFLSFFASVFFFLSVFLFPFFFLFFFLPIWLSFCLPSFHDFLLE